MSNVFLLKAYFPLCFECVKKRKRDPLSAPKVGDRVPYVIIKAPLGKKRKKEQREMHFDEKGSCC